MLHGKFSSNIYLLHNFSQNLQLAFPTGCVTWWYTIGESTATELFAFQDRMNIGHLRDRELYVVYTSLLDKSG